MAEVAKRPARYEDLLALPEHVVGEIVDGELFASPRPSPRHANASTGISVDVGGPFHRGRGGPGGWWILVEPEIHLGSDVLVPDLAGWKRERMPVLPETAWFELTPDWVCEVISPSTGRLDRVRKLPIYARESVPFAWLVDPISRTLEVFKLEGDRWLLLATQGGDDVVRVEPFDAIEIRLEGWWSPG